MPEATTAFTPAPDWRQARLAAAGIAVRPRLGLMQTLVSGALGPALAELAVARPAVGALAEAEGDPYAVRLGRERALVVGEVPAPRALGWRTAGYAASALDAGLLVFELTGNRLEELLAQATSLDLRQPGPSASLLFAGTAAIVYRRGGPDRLRLHVPRPRGPSIWRWLALTLGALERDRTGGSLASTARDGL